MGWLNDEEFESDAARSETIERMSSVFSEFADECKVTDFIVIVANLEKSNWFNSRVIRNHVRKNITPAVENQVEARIWPLEVNLVFEQVDGASELGEPQQNKVKAQINQLWLERMAKDEIIALAAGMVSELSGVAA